MERQKKSGKVLPSDFFYIQPLVPYAKLSIKSSYSIITLVSICILIHFPGLRNDFQWRWDDWWVAVNDYTEGGLNGANIKRILTEYYHGQYAPVNQLQYLLIYSIFEYDPFWFHFAGLVIHNLNVILVFLLVKRLSKFLMLPANAIQIIPFITALLMACSPILVEAVAWVSASKCILFSFFYLLSIHTYISYLNKKNTGFLLLTIICFVLSFGSKEQAVTLPGCLLLIDYLFKRNLKNPKVWIEKTPIFIMTLVFVYITVSSQNANGEGILSGQQLHPLHQNILFACYSTLEYFIKTILPVRLSYLYPFPNLPTQAIPFHFWLYPFVLLFLGMFLWRYRHLKWLQFGLGFYLVQVSVVSNLIPTSRYAIIADRYSYLPSIGVFFLMAYFFYYLFNRTRNKNLIISLLCSYCLLCSWYTRVRIGMWKDSEILKSEISNILQNRSDYKEWMEKHELD